MSTSTARPAEVSSGFAGSFTYSQYGIQNDSASEITEVDCPIPISTVSPGADVITAAYMTVYDRSTTANVSCSLQRAFGEGTVSYSVSANTAGCGPGTGPQDLHFTITGAPFADGYWRVHCTIPGAESGWVSHVTSITVTTTN